MMMTGRARCLNNPDDVFYADVKRPLEYDATSTTLTKSISRHSPRPPPDPFEEHRQLWNAVLDGRVDVLRSLLVDKKMNPNARSSTGATAGHQAAMEGRVEELSVLICHGLDIDAVDNEGNTALHLASRHGRAGVTRRLIDAFPNEELRNHRGLTALDQATRAGHVRCKKCIEDFADFGKAKVLKEHCVLERDRLEKARRRKEILFGRDLDLPPRVDDFRSMRASVITAGDREIIYASLEARAVVLRCIAAGLHSAEKELKRRAKRSRNRRKLKSSKRKLHKKR